MAFCSVMKMEAMCSLRVIRKLRGERTRKSDITTEIYVKYVNRQPSDPVAFNDYHVADDVQYVASKCV